MTLLQAGQETSKEGKPSSLLFKERGGNKASCLLRRAGDSKGSGLRGKAWFLDLKPWRTWRGARREGGEHGGREGTLPWDPGGHLQAEPGPSTSDSVLSTTPLSFWVALSKLLNLSGTSTQTTKQKSAYLAGTECCGWAGGPVRHLGKRSPD